MDTWNLSDKNMISGKHIATGYPIDIQLTMQEMILACAELVISINTGNLCAN